MDINDIIPYVDALKVQYAFLQYTDSGLDMKTWKK